MSTVKIACVPFYPKMGELKKNLKATIEIINGIIKENKDSLPDCIIFPELSLSGYALENLVAECTLSHKSDLIEQLEVCSKKTAIVLGSVWIQQSSFFNTALVFENGKLAHIQKKIYLPTYGMFDEARYFRGGESLELWHAPFGTSSILICEDAWHPVLPYASYQQKAQFVFVMSNSPIRGPESYIGSNKMKSQRHWQAMLNTYSQNFAQFYVYVNRSGVEDGLYYSGEIYACSPLGDIIEPQQREGYSLLDLNMGDFHSAASLGGPHQNENFALNQKILEDSYYKRTEEF